MAPSYNMPLKVVDTEHSAFISEFAQTPMHCVLFGHAEMLMHACSLSALQRM